jgi:signal transduction histidine kinase
VLVELATVQQNTLIAEEQRFVLSSSSPGPVQRRIAACIVVGLLVALYLITGPLSGIQLGQINSFVAVYATAMFVTDAITAVLLYAQFTILRSRAILVIASGYLFTALIVVVYVTAFPAVLAPQGLIGGMQTAAWLYVTWHCGFATFVIVYALTKDASASRPVPKRQIRSALLSSVACSFALAAAAAVVATKAEPHLPKIMLDPLRFGPDWPYLVGGPIASLCLTAIAVLWVRRRSVLDLWLMVVMCLYLVEVPLSWYPLPARFSTGWYAVRVVGFLSSSLVLVILLYEITTLYARLLNAVVGQRREREARLMTGDAVAASIAHEMRQPLAAMVTTADAGFRFLDRPAPNLDKAKEAFKRIVGDGHRAGDLVGEIRSSFKSDVRDRTSFDLNELIQEALALGASELQRHRVLVQVKAGWQGPPVKGNRVQLQQVLVNLILNAIDAMATKSDPRVLTISSVLHQGEQVKVSVADNGVGIESVDADRVFSPLFTTKADGMGMGLSICRAIVEAHEGQLWFSPNTPNGAVFQFTLPVAGPGTSAG